MSQEKKNDLIENPIPDGLGKRILPNGDIQEGEFKNNKFWNGILKDKDGNIISNILEGSGFE